jgi:hypothetical protein
MLRVAPGKARGHVVYSPRPNTTPLSGWLLTTLRSLTVIHIQPPGSGVATSEAHPSWGLRPFDGLARGPGAMACSWHVSCSLDAPAGRVLQP